MEVTLPSGNIVVLRERVTNADRYSYIEASERGETIDVAVEIPVTDPATGEPLLDGENKPIIDVRVVKQPTWAGTMVVNSVAMAILVDSWSFDLPLPITRPLTLEDRDALVHTLDFDLDLSDYDALLVAATPVIRKMFVKTTPSLDPKGDADSPSTPSSD